MIGTFDAMILTPRTFGLAGVDLPAEDLESLQGLAPALGEMMGVEVDALALSVQALRQTDRSRPAEMKKALAGVLSGLAALKGQRPERYERGAERFLLTRLFNGIDPGQAVVEGAQTAVGNLAESPGSAWFLAQRERIVIAFWREWVAFHPAMPGVLINGSSYEAATAKFQLKFPLVKPTLHFISMD